MDGNNAKSGTQFVLVFIFLAIVNYFIYQWSDEFGSLMFNLCIWGYAWVVYKIVVAFFYN